MSMGRATRSASCPPNPGASTTSNSDWASGIGFLSYVFWDIIVVLALSFQRHNLVSRGLWHKPAPQPVRPSVCLRTQTGSPRHHHRHHARPHTHSHSLTTRPQDLFFVVTPSVGCQRRKSLTQWVVGSQEPNPHQHRTPANVLSRCCALNFFFVRLGLPRLPAMYVDRVMTKTNRMTVRRRRLGGQSSVRRPRRGGQTLCWPSCGGTR